MKRMHHKVGSVMQYGGSKSVSNYYEMYGWVYNKSRTDELDRWLEDFLSKQGWDNEEIGAFLVSQIW